MTEVLLLTLMLAGPGTSPSTFDIQTDLQGLYDEISQATLQFATESDVDQFHDVLYTPDWVFVDETGLKQTWPQVRERAIRALSEPHPDSVNQAIQKLSLGPDGATVVVVLTIVHIVASDGRHDGQPGASRTLVETATFRDQWVRVSDEWKLKSRQQTGGLTASKDKSEWNRSEDSATR